MTTFYTSTLLGTDPRALEASQEFQAFRSGLDLHLTPNIPSLCNVSVFTLSKQWSENLILL
jgi:hypothetical protein